MIDISGSIEQLSLIYFIWYCIYLKKTYQYCEMQLLFLAIVSIFLWHLKYETVNVSFLILEKYQIFMISLCVFLYAMKCFTHTKNCDLLYSCQICHILKCYQIYLCFKPKRFFLVRTLMDQKRGWSDWGEEKMLLTDKESFLCFRVYCSWLCLYVKNVKEQISVVIE